MHLSSTFSEHLKIFTDGSVLDSGNAGAAYIIPDLHIEETFYLGQGKSIFTAELVAILMALTKIISMNIIFLRIILCVDSMSVLQALQSTTYGERKGLIIEIQHVVMLSNLE